MASATNTVADVGRAPDNDQRCFKINRRNFSGHYDITTTDGKHLFYIDTWSFSSGKPDLTMHEGPPNKSPVVAVSHMPSLSLTYKIGLGDPNRLASMDWEEIGKEHLTKSGWRWTTTVLEGANRETKLSLEWKRTAKMAVDGMAIRFMSSRNYKLQDTDTNDILAVFTSDRDYRKCGVLQVKKVSCGR